MSLRNPMDSGYNETCCTQDTRTTSNERRTTNAYLHASLPRRLNGAEALVGLGLVNGSAIWIYI